MSNTFNSGDPGTQSAEQGSSFSDQAAVTDQTQQQGTNEGTSNQNQSVDVNKLMKRLDDSQAFIEQLKQERAEDRRLLDELKNKQTPNIDEIMEKVNQARSTDDNPVDPDVLVNQVYDKVNQSMTAKEQSQREEANVKSVAEVLQKQFGDDVDSQVAKLAQENDMTFDEVFAMAKRSPKAALKLLGVSGNVSQSSATPTGGSLNTQGYSQTPPAKQRHIMSARTEKERVAILNEYYSKALKG